MKIILLEVVIFFVLSLSVKGQIVFCTEEADITYKDESTFVFNTKLQNQSSTKFIKITKGGASIPYNATNVACLDYYVELSKAGATKQEMDANKFSSDPMGYMGRGCYPSIITTGGEIHAIGSVNLHDNSTVTNSPNLSGIQGNDVGTETVLKLAFMDFGWSSAMTNVMIEAYDLKIVIIDKCSNKSKELVLPAGSWNVLEANIRIVDLEGDAGPSITVPDLALCKNDAEGSVTATVSGITNAYTVSWAAEAGSSMPGGISYASSGTGKTDDILKIDPAVAAAGSYQIRATVTDDTDATITADTVFNVNIHPAVVVAITTNESGTGGVCESMPVQLTASPTGADYTYKWRNTDGFNNDVNMTTASADSASVTGTLAGVAGGSSRKYEVVVTNTATGCSATADTTIAVKVKPNIILKVNGLTGNTVAVCEGTAVTLTAQNMTSADEAVTTYAWITPSTGGSTNPLTVYPTQPSTTYEVKGTVNGCSMSVQKTVTLNPKPEIQLTHNPDSVCALTLGGSGDVDLTTVGISSSTALVAANTKYYQADWTAVTNPSAVTLTAGSHNFWLVGETAQGCIDSLSFTAKVNDLPAVPLIAGDNEVCAGSPVAVGVQSPQTGVTYSWYEGTTNLGTGTSLPDTYKPTTFAAVTVEVADANGCKNVSASHTINVNALPVIASITATPATGCAGDVIALTANITPGTAGAGYHQYNWTGVTTVQTADSTQAGLTLAGGTNNYSLAVTDTKGCTSATQTGSLYGHQLTVVLNSAGGTVGNAITLQAVTTKDGAAAVPNGDVYWEFSQVSPVAKVECAKNNGSNSCSPVMAGVTKYKVRVNDTVTGCWAEDTLTPRITPATLLNVTGTSVTLCYGETDFSGKEFVLRVSGGVPPYTYSWSAMPSWLTYSNHGDTLKITDISDWAAAAAASPLTVSCEVKDAVNKTKTATLSLTVRSLTTLTINSVADGGEWRTCQFSGNGSAVDLTVAGSKTLNSVNWLTPSASTNPLSISTATANAGTDYEVTAVDNNGCQTDTTTVSVIIDALPGTGTLAAVVAGTSVKDGSVCPGTPVAVSVTGASGSGTLTYAWSNDSTGTTTTWTPTATDSLLILTVSDDHCSAKDTVQVNTYTPEVIQLATDTTLCETETTAGILLTASGLTGGSVYTWTGGELAAAGVSGASMTVNPASSPMTYTVSGTDVHGCAVTPKSIVVNVDEMPVFTLTQHDLAACSSVNLYTALGTVTPGAVVKYGTTAGFTGGTVLSDPTSLSADGKYYLRAENGTCRTDEDTVRVTILTRPQLVLSSVTLANCEPDSVDLDSAINWTATTFTASNITYWQGATQLTSSVVYPGVGSQSYTIKGSSAGCSDDTKTVTVNIHPKPVLAISAADTMICAPGKGDLTSAVVAAAGSAAITQSAYYSDAAFTTAVPDASAVESGTYYVIGKTVNSCADTAEVRISVKPQPVFAVATPAQVCEPAAVDLTTLPGTVTDVTYTYFRNASCTDELTGGNLTLTTAADSGTYYVVGTLSPTGCTDTVAVNVVINRKPQVNISGDTIYCWGENVDLTASGAANYNWYESAAGGVTHGGGNVSWTPTNPGDYTFSVEGATTQGCKDSASVTVHVIELPKVSVRGPQEACSSETITLTADTTGLTNGPFTYTWTNATATTANEATALFSTHTADNETIRVHLTDRYGCVGPDSSIVVQINGFQPTLTVATATAPLGDSDQVAPGTTVTLTAGPAGDYEYLFLKVGMTDTVIQDFSSVNTLTHTVTVETTYKLVVKNTTTNCQDTVTFNVRISGQQLDMIADHGATVCFGDTGFAGKSLKAHATGGQTPYTYAWVVPDAGIVLNSSNVPTNGATEATITSINGVAAGTYRVKVIVTDGNGSRDSVEVDLTVNALPEIVLNTTTADTCDGFSVDLSKFYTADANAAYTYFKVADGSAVNNMVNAAGDYKVVATFGSTGCRNTSGAITVTINPNPTVSLPEDGHVVCAGSVIDVKAVGSGGTGNLTYRWTSGAVGTAVDSIGSLRVHALANAYAVEVEDAKGCKSTASGSITGDSVYVSLSALPASPVAANTSVTWTASAGSTAGSLLNYEFVRTSADPDEVKPSQAGNTYMETISEKTCYRVMIESSVTGCRDTSAEVCVEVDASTLLKVIAQGDTVCSGTGVVASLTSATSGSGTVTSYAWRQISGTPALAIADATLQNISVDVAGAAMGVPYEFEVSVNGGISKDTATLVVRQGVEITSLVALDSCSADVIFETVATNATAYAWSSLMPLDDVSFVGYVKPDGTKCKFSVNNGTDYRIQLIASNTHCKDTAVLAGRTYIPGLSLAFAGNDTCGNNVDLPLTSSVNDGYGNLVARYQYTSFDGSLTRADSVPFGAFDVGKIENAVPGIYALTAIYAKGAPHCVLAVHDTVKVGNLPVVELTESCLALHKDTIFNLNLVNTGDYAYIWSVSESSDGAAWTTGGPGDGSTTSTINGTMGDKDLQYIITASDRQIAACKASDTAHVYRIPDAPVIDIDTNTTRFNIKVHWNDVVKADGYDLMHILWDGYATAGNYQSKQTYMAGDTSWAVTNMTDTLEFFYVVSVRDICGVDYRSVSSDTVGYFRQWVKGFKASNPSSIAAGGYLGRINYISYPFDMSAKGISAAEDILEKLLGNIGGYEAKNNGFVGYNKSTNPLYGATGLAEEWAQHSYVYVDGYPAFSGWDPTVPNFNLIAGQVYQICVYDSIRVSDVLMYGKLPQRKVYDLRYIPNTTVATDKTTENFIVTPLSFYADFIAVSNNTAGVVPNTATVLGDAVSPGLEKKLEKISVWNFEEQAMRSVDYIQVPGMSSFNMWSPPMKSVNILMFSPVSIQMHEDLLNWTK